MTAVWETAWVLGAGEAQDDFVTLAREGEALLAALGGTRPAESAAQLRTGVGEVAAFGRWTDRYAAAVDAVQGMPLAVLFAGVSGWDVRGDFVLQALTRDRPTPPTWEQLRTLAATRQLRPGVAASFDWFASRALGLEGGNEGQRYAAAAQRAWWAQYLDRAPMRSVPVATPPAPTVNPQPPTVNPPTVPVRRSNDNAAVIAVLAALWAYSRRKRRAPHGG